ncbi:MAG TPA: 30S ribosomal protein S15 [Candidatus Nanoarchaeia archaeon]|nr:30S ribosomal protein S15 [Candidatus Nanoarchaeia archaeon]
MARLYSGKKGKSGSKKPLKKTKPSWLRYEPKEVEQLVIKHAKQGMAPALIGLTLRDTYGIPNVKVVTGKNITTILVENEISTKIPYDLRALVIQDIALMKHLENFKQDQVARRGLLLNGSKIKRLVTYYKREGILPATWMYERDKAKLLLE